MPESELGNGVRHLKAHLQHARGRERQPELRDQQRQERRIHVAVAVDEEVRAGEQQHGGVQAQEAAVRAGSLPGWRSSFQSV